MVRGAQALPSNRVHPGQHEPSRCLRLASHEQFEADGSSSQALCVRPQAGLIVLFPSSLVHNVRMYHGERPRISVPFNAHTHIVT